MTIKSDYYYYYVDKTAHFVSDAPFLVKVLEYVIDLCFLWVSLSTVNLKQGSSHCILR